MSTPSPFGTVEQLELLRRRLLACLEAIEARDALEALLREALPHLQHDHFYSLVGGGECPADCIVQRVGAALKSEVAE